MYRLVSGTLIATALACGGCDRAYTLTTADGLERSYIVHQPSGRRGEAGLPVVLALHGGGGNARSLKQALTLDATADAHGFIAVYPDGTGDTVLGKAFNAWNGGYCCGPTADDRAARDGVAAVDDVAFFAALLDQLEADLDIDETRVYATGISNGGIMSHRLAAELPERIAAIAPIASPGPATEWQADTPVPVLVIHGTEDKCALFDGGEQCGGCFARVMQEVLGTEPTEDDTFACLSVEDQVDWWAEVNSCGPLDEVFFSEGAATCTAASSCEGGAVATCIADGGGHTWPGAPEDCTADSKVCEAYRNEVGEINTDMDANEQMWSFFAGYSTTSR